MKTCGVCKKSLPLDSFWRQKDGKHGRMATCKRCRAQYQERFRREVRQYGDPLICRLMRNWRRAI